MKKLSAIAKLMKAGQKAIRLVRYVSKKAISLRADLGFGKMPLRRNQLAWAAEVLRTFVDGCRASEVRHLVFSVPKKTGRRAAIKLLFEIFEDWRVTYAPDRAWVAAIHFHDGGYHLHVAIANAGPDGKPLKFKPHQVIAMADMKFTTRVISAKGLGKKGLPVYSKARGKLAVRDLAALLVDDTGNLLEDEWDRLEKEGVISNFRLRKKDGAVTSFEFGGKRIRLKTLRAFVLENQTTKGTTMPVDDIKTDQPLPDSIADSLLKAGFSAKDLDALNTDLQTLDQAHEQAPEKDGPDINPNLPPR